MLNVTSYMHQQMFKLQISLNYALIPEIVVSEMIGLAIKAVDVNWFHVTHVLANLIINSIHA